MDVWNEQLTEENVEEAAMRIAAFLVRGSFDMYTISRERGKMEARTPTIRQNLELAPMTQVRVTDEQHGKGIAFDFIDPQEERIRTNKFFATTHEEQCSVLIAGDITVRTITTEFVTYRTIFTPVP